MKKPLDELTAGFDTMQRHEFMYKYAELNEKKGKKGGCCNITQCQKEGACCFNGSTRAYYCLSCWSDIYNSATYGGQCPVDWMDPKDRVADFTFEYEGGPDILLGHPTVSEEQQALLDEMASVRGKIRKGMDKEHPLLGKFLSQTTTGHGHLPWKRKGNKVGRNSECPCGSGGKYKKCCGGTFGSM